MTLLFSLSWHQRFQQFRKSHKLLLTALAIEHPSEVERAKGRNLTTYTYNESAARQVESPVRCE